MNIPTKTNLVITTTATDVTDTALTDKTFPRPETTYTVTFQVEDDNGDVVVIGVMLL